jgi:putative membrane protein
LEDTYMMFGPSGWGGGGFGFLGMLPMLFFWLLIIAGVVLLIRWAMIGGNPRQSGPGESALDILKKRYARGEIDKEEFDAKRRELA